MEKKETKTIICETLIEYGKPTAEGDVFVKGCFGDSIKQMKIQGKILDYEEMEDGVVIINEFEITGASIGDGLRDTTIYIPKN